MNSPCSLRANFPLVLKRWRLKNGISRKRMAAELGFGLSTVGAWERGERFPDGFALDNIITYTHLTPCRLFCDREDRCAPGQCVFLRVRA